MAVCMQFVPSTARLVQQIPHLSTTSLQLFVNLEYFVLNDCAGTGNLELRCTKIYQRTL